MGLFDDRSGQRRQDFLSRSTPLPPPATYSIPEENLRARLDPVRFESPPLWDSVDSFKKQAAGSGFASTATMLIWAAPPNSPEHLSWSLPIGLVPGQAARITWIKGPLYSAMQTRGFGPDAELSCLLIEDALGTALAAPIVASDWYTEAALSEFTQAAGLAFAIEPAYGIGTIKAHYPSLLVLPEVRRVARSSRWAIPVDVMCTLAFALLAFVMLFAFPLGALVAAGGAAVFIAMTCNSYARLQPGWHPRGSRS